MKKALLLIDIQNDYFENGTMRLLGSEAAAQKTKGVLQTFREQQLPIIHIQHSALSPEATFFKPNTPGAEIYKEVTPLPTEMVIIKHYPNSFRETTLLKYLQENNITELVICGMMTHLCVDATVRAAKDFGFHCEVLSDCCATKNLELNGETVNATAVQHSFLAALSFFYAKVTTASDYLKALL